MCGLFADYADLSAFADLADLIKVFKQIRNLCLSIRI
jgi:hypothetical protein